jgi:hypothetical protein
LITIFINTMLARLCQDIFWFLSASANFAGQERMGSAQAGKFMKIGRKPHRKCQFVRLVEADCS